MHFVIAFDNKLWRDIPKILNIVLLLYCPKRINMNKQKTVFQIIDSLFKQL